MTPEGKVKAKVTKVLKSFGDRLYYFMPVQYGMGAASLDYLCAVKTKFDYDGPIFFAIETKAPGKKPTDRQQALMDYLTKMGAVVWTIDDDAGVKELKLWLDSLH
jgi:hypothetical protein